jgi:hypothetical protein
VKTIRKISPKQEREIQSLAVLLEIISRTQPKAGYVDLYRGHPDKAHTLKPHLFRKLEYRRVEKDILRELIAIQPHEFREDGTAFERLVRMQHYGLPTRLLDLTYNPLVGLYFACSKDTKKDGELLRFRIHGRNIKYFDSDTVSCVANLSNLSGRERDQIRRMATSKSLMRVRSDLDCFILLKLKSLISCRKLRFPT